LITADKPLSTVTHPVDLLLIENLSSMSLYARSLIYDRDVAESMVQEACQRILERRNQLLTEDVRSYALTIVRNLAMDYLRARPHEEYQDDVMGNDPLPEDQAEVRQYLEIVRQLEQPCAETLTLFGMGYRQREISKMLGRAIGTIGSLIQRCRALLRRYV
jgi:RNA polymerase sigma factor (sigma-70 family)